MRTEWKPDIEKRVNNIAFPQLMRYGFWVEGRAKENMSPLYDSNHPWSYRGFEHPEIKADRRSGLARASIHTVGIKSEHRVKVGCDKNDFAGSSSGSNVFYFGYLEFGTWAMPELAPLRKALDALIQLVGGRRG